MVAWYLSPLHCTFCEGWMILLVQLFNVRVPDTAPLRRCTYPPTTYTLNGLSGSGCRAISPIDDAYLGLSVGSCGPGWGRQDQSGGHTSCCSAGQAGRQGRYRKQVPSPRQCLQCDGHATMTTTTLPFRTDQDTNSQAPS